MRPVARSLVATLAGAFPLPEPIVEFGSYQVAGQEAEADLRPLFSGREYVGCDLRTGPGVDLVADITATGLGAGTVGTVVVLDTLEHVEHPRAAMRELARILSPHGLVLATSVMQFPIHEHPADYWRFTPSGFASLLSQFPRSWTAGLGEPDFPITVAGVAAGPAREHWDRMVATLEAWAAAEQHMHEAMRDAGWTFDTGPCNCLWCRCSRP